MLSVWMSKAGLMSRFTGGNWAVSPNSIILQLVPEYTYEIKSSSKEPFSYNLESELESEIIDASSTIKTVFLCLFCCKVNEMPPPEFFLGKYIFLWIVKAGLFE